MTANLEALLPGAVVLFDTDDKWAQQPLRGKRGVVVHRYDAALGVGTDVVVCIGPCAKPTHDLDCHAAVAFSADELLLVPAEAAS